MACDEMVTCVICLGVSVFAHTYGAFVGLLMALKRDVRYMEQH